MGEAIWERGLNKEQRLAVTTTEGPILISAGPGTGKTRTLVCRILYLLLEKGVAADHILALTFTRKASLSLISRLSSALEEVGRGGEAGKIHAMNFHQLAQLILDRYPERAALLPSYRILSEDERMALLFRHWSELAPASFLNCLFPSFKAVPSPGSYHSRQLLIFYDKLREGFVDWEEESEPMSLAKTSLSCYRQLLVEENALDFSEMLFRASLLLENDPEVLADLQEWAEYLMVDEYQDTNPVQEKMVQALQEKSHNLCVVGDDDQSIYRFRGATVQNILGFSQRYPGSRVINLKTNYRSDGEILSFASRFINTPYRDLRLAGEEDRLSSYRMEKELVAADPANVHPNAVMTLSADSREEWVDQLVEAVQSIYKKTGAYSSIAILAHSVHTPPMQALLSALRRAGIPCYTPNEASPFSYAEVKRMTACYYLALRDYLPEGLGQQEERAVYEEEAARLPDRGRKEREEAVRVLDKKLAEGGRLSPLDWGYAFLACPPFSPILDKGLGGNPLARQQLSRLSFLLRKMEAYAERQGFKEVGREEVPAFASFLLFSALPFLKESRPRLEQQEGEGLEVREDRLTVMTIHLSKGLEFPAVILLEPGRLPSFRYRRERQGIDLLKASPLLGRQLDEERQEELDEIRLYYTAFTRAESLLLLTHEGGQAARIHPAFQPFQLTCRRYRAEALDSLSWKKRERGREKQPYAYTSDIVPFLRCPRFFFFFRLLSFPQPFSSGAAFGSLVHASLLEVHRSLPHPDGEKACLRAWEGLRRSGLPLSQEEGDRARKQVLSYMERERDGLLKEASSAERELRAAAGNYLMKGRIDLLARGDSELVDFKTGSWEELPISRLSAYQGQLKYYRILMDKNGMGEGRNSLYFVSQQQKRKDFSFSREELARFQQEVDGVVRRIESGNFEEKTDDPAHCRSCPLRTYCLSGEASTTGKE